MRKLSIMLSLAMLFASCGNKGKAPLLTGAVAGGDSLVIQAHYDVDGDTYLDEIITDATGRFTYDPPVDKAVDLTLYVNGASYGIRIGEGSPMSIVIDTLGEATFTGDNLVESQWLTACMSGYDARRYKHIKERDGAYDATKYIAMIDNARIATDEILPRVTDDSLREYYGSLGRQYYDRTKAQILRYDYVYNGREAGAPYPAELESLAQIDPNADAARRTGALYEYGVSLFPRSYDNPVEDVRAAFARIDSVVVNPANRRMLHNNCSEMVFVFGNLSADTLRTYVDGISDGISHHQREVLMSRIRDLENRTSNGDKVPCDPIIVRPDGSKVALSKACAGKVAYIDMWATWCGPCCAQIPYMEKIAEHYKDNQSVICISISCDEDLDAWHKKLAQDNPQWPQYVFTGESGQQFMNAMGVTTIPRFILINPDMTIADIDAPRPQSDVRLKQAIDSLVSARKI